MININENCGDSLSGFIFKLEKKSAYEGVLSINDLTKVKFVKNSFYVYLNSASIYSLNDLDEQFEILQHALDYLSLRNIQNSSVRIPLNDYFFWNKVNGKYSITFISKAMSEIIQRGSQDISTLNVTAAHEGFRFFRFSQISYDLLDAYRYMWLSFESLITTHIERTLKKNGKSESEEEWYRRAIQELAASCQCNDLKKILEKQTCKQLMKRLYNDLRCSLFHSKSGEKVRIPHKKEQYESVKLSLTDLTIIVSSIVSYYYSIKTPFLYVNPCLLVDPYIDLFNGLVLVISDLDEAEVVLGGTLEGINFEYSTKNVSHNSKIQKTYVQHLFKACIKKDKCIEINEISRFSLCKNNKEMLVFLLDEKLSITGVSEVKVEFYYNFDHNSKPRTYNYHI